jgi:hypothetical protein
VTLSRRIGVYVIAIAAAAAIVACPGSDEDGEVVHQADGAPGSDGASSSGGSSGGSSGAASGDGGSDASSDAPADVKTDATKDGAVVDGSCPGACNGGCDAGACIIVVNSSSDVTCPAGQDCVVQCTSSQRCTSTINCAPDAGCIVECTTTKACDSLDIERNGATKLCLRCVGADQACNSVTCDPGSNCSRVCSGTGTPCNSACEACATVAACP